MRRLLGVGLLVVVVGCQTVDDRAALRPLPESFDRVSYAELLLRARSQTRIATEAFYVDNWIDLEDSANALQQTAKLLPKSTDVPVKHKDTLVDHGRQLGQQAVELAKAAREKDAKAANTALQRLNLKVRQLKLAPEDKGLKP